MSALGVLAACFISAFSLQPALWFCGLGPVEPGEWISADCTSESRTLSVGERLYYTDRNRVWCHEKGAENRFDFSGSPCFATGETALGYVPGESAVMLLSGSGKWIRVPGAVDAVIAGKNVFGVILSGSGYLTNTVIYDAFGNKLGEKGFVEEAMWGGCFPDENGSFAALTFSKDGLWRVRFYLQNGQLLWQHSFESESVPEILSLGDRGVLITDEEIMMFDDTGEVVSVHSFGVWEPCMTASGREILAIVTTCRGKYRIMTVSSSGEIPGQWELSQMPEDVKVSAGKIFVLDPGSLLVYDAFGKLRLSSSEGARAGKLEATESCVWLVGNGELMQIKTS